MVMIIYSVLVKKKKSLLNNNATFMGKETV